MKRIAVLTSGGDAPGMNAAIRAVVRAGIGSGLQVFGVKKGYEGLIEDDIMRVGRKDVGGILYRGGTFLMSARSPRFMEEKYIDLAAENLRSRGIEGIVVIGGDGTYRGASRLSDRGIKVVGVPGTIDNDLGYTDYTIGFDTAVNTVVDLMNKVRDTSSSHERTTIMEVMGRHCGDIALYAGLSCGADVVLVPEVPVTMEDIVNKVREGQKMGKRHIIIAKAEGVDIPTSEMQQILESLTQQETRSVIPGYIQRGGSPSAQDRLIAALMSAKAVEVLKDKSGSYGDASYAIGVQGNRPIVVDLNEAVESKRAFRQDIYDLANLLG